MPQILLVGPNLVSYTGYRTPSRRVLDDVLAEVGLRYDDVFITEPARALADLRRLRPNVAVALGDIAASTLIPGWNEDPDASTMMRRGFLYNGLTGAKVLVSVDPQQAATQVVPWRVLLNYDLQRAAEESISSLLERPERNVEIVTSAHDARRLADELIRSRRVACDIEIHDSTTLACVGFAPSRDRAIVFPAEFFDDARRVLLSDVPKLFQNGQFDLHFLATRCGVRVRAYRDDTLIAWHACYPELAGASEDTAGNRKNKTTRKSLAFLASIFTRDAWWKDYDWSTIEEFYVLNGRDCCITFDVMEHLDALINRQDVRRIYEHGIALVWPCVDMQARGLPIDDKLRTRRIEALATRVDAYAAQLAELAIPLIEREWDRIPETSRHLFIDRRVCECCRNGKGKRDECWACAGYDRKPTKKMLAERGIVPTVCARCEGAGEFRRLVFNGGSVDQKRILLYDILKLPKRYETKKDKKKGTKRTVLSTNEDTLKGLLAHVA